MNRLLKLLAVIAVGAAFGAAGCGGDDETTSATTTAVGATGEAGVPVSDDEFVTEANAICAAGNGEIDTAAEELFTAGEPTDAELDQFANDVLVPSIEGQIEAIGALTPPDEIADEVTTFLEDAEAALDEVESDPSLLAGNTGAADPFADVNDEAAQLGLDECAG